jgi:nitrogen fixation NifU-like protein
MNDLRDLYEEMILDHNRNPRNFQHRPIGQCCEGHGFNPLCGDDVSVHLKVEDGVIRDVGFDGVGCAIAMASASLMSEAIKGKSEAEVRHLFEQMHAALTNGGIPEGETSLGKLAVFAGVREFPMRVKCATLAWHVLKAALDGEKGTVCTE